MIQKIEFVGELKNINNAIAANKSIFVNLVKNQGNKIETFSRKCVHK